MPLHSLTLPVGPLQCNCTLVWNDTTHEAIIIDPGGDADKLLALLQEKGLTLRACYHTHAHFDHFMASEQLRQATGASLWLNEGDLFLWQNLELQCQRFRLPTAWITQPEAPDGLLEDEQPLLLGESVVGTVHHTPGHTPGSCCFEVPEAELILSGDTLFKQGVGRTDLWGGNSQQLKESLKRMVQRLNPSYTVVAGHGPSTTLEAEERSNPYL
ncbi:MAG: MBL fold metallo-hydrolase [Vampirovibrionales bacterium]